ncbi:solute carrier family 25 member 32 [Planococcus citri]|uniref:solute carrier family 25 member 32 n=1 Tax=Planococcus citri TaxID=170843 RepID=UPI0031F87BC4
MKSSTNHSNNVTVFKHVKYEHLVAGITGGVTSTLLLHPLDLLKIRFAVCDGRHSVPQYNSLTGAVSQICKQEGIRGLYKGVTPNVWGSGSAWGLYFLFYNSIKNWIQGGNTKKPLGPTMHMTAAAEAGVLTLILTNPVWVVKTRLCLQYAEEQHSLKNYRYNGMLDALRKIYNTEGVRGLYRGFVPGMLGVTHGALQFMTYEEMKTYYNQYRNVPIDSKLSTLEYIGFAAVSKFVAAVATYPYQVIRARLQDHHLHYEGTWDCFTKTWRYEGWLGFYKGLTPNLLRVIPATAVTFVVYENVSSFLMNTK